jgi:hypothetical protein
MMKQWEARARRRKAVWRAEADKLRGKYVGVFNRGEMSAEECLKRFMSALRRLGETIDKLFPL